MTASFKSKVEVEDRTLLYYNNFKYKVVLKDNAISFVFRAKTIEQYVQYVKQQILLKDPWSRKIRLEDIDLSKMEGLIKFRANHYKDPKIQTRQYDSAFSVYTNDENIIKEICKFWSDPKIHEANLVPAGIKYFKKDPPAKFRVYLKSFYDRDGNIKEDLKEYLKRTPDLVISESLSMVLNYNFTYLSTSHFINYNDEKNLMMMYLMFPNIIGKRYKLEKKTV